MSKYKLNASMFETIKEALNKTNDTGGGQFANILRMPAGKTYTVRLLANFDNFEKTYFTHYVHSFTSLTTGQFINTLSLQTFGEPDPLTDYFWKMIKGSEEDKKIGKIIRRKDQWFVNVLVEDDPSNPENNGTVKVLKFGTQLKKIIDEFFEGERSKKYGLRIFDLSDKGAVFKIKAEASGDFVKFEKSYFEDAETGYTDDQLDDIYSQAHDLEQILPVKTYDEILEILNTHVLGATGDKHTNTDVKKPLATVKKNAEPSAAELDDVDDDIPFLSKKEPQKSEEIDIDDFDDLLKGLDS